MKNLGRILLILLSITSFTLAQVSAKVSQVRISKGEAIKVTLEAQGSQVEFPSNEAIEKALGYPIENMGVSTQTFFQFNSNSGSTKEVKKSMSFSFYPNSSMKIPAFDIKVDDKVQKSNPIDIEVSAIQTSTISNELFKAQISVSKDEAMVGEPIDVTLKFYRRVDQNVMKLQYAKPIFTNFEVKEKGEVQPTRKGNYVIQRLSYTIYPKKDGNLTIDPAVIKIATPQNNQRNPRDIFGAMFMDTKWSKVVSNALSINVKPIPKGASLIGRFDISVSIDHQEVKANKPVKLKVEISGEGTLDSLEEIEYDLDGVTCFSDDAKIESKVHGDGTIHSSYKKSFVFLSDGDFTIPKREIKFYNTSTQQIETLVIPKYKITIKGGKPKAQSVVTTNKQNNQPIEIKVAPKEVEKEIVTKNNPLWIALAYILGVLSTLFVIYLVPKIKSMQVDKLFNDDEVFKTLYANMDQDPRIEQIVRDLRAKKQGDKSVVIDKKEIKEILESIKVQRF
ncbi:MAG: BatD family protein [Campylobacterota bacterium]|nr:BatD family protein [Campylobacterota bacterium]